MRWLTFGLEPVDPKVSVDGHLIFIKPVTVTVDMDGFPVWMHPYVHHQVDLFADKWEPVEFTYDAGSQILTIILDSFSDVGVNGASQYPSDGSNYLMTNLPNVSAFSGAATYNYTFDIPDGRNEMTPQLGVTYNSAGINGIMGVVQSNYVGIGWHLTGLASIVRKIKNEYEGDPGGIDMRWQYENDFTLILNGASYELEGPVPLLDTGVAETTTKGDGGCRYYAEDAPGLLIMRYTADSTSSEWCGYGEYDTLTLVNRSEEFWVVTTQNGTRYRLGFNDDSEQIVEMEHYDAVDKNCDLYACGTPGVCSGDWISFGGYAGEDEDFVASRWSVDTIWDTFGNAIFIGYDEEQTGSPSWDHAQYPEWIRYTGTYSGGTPDTTTGKLLVDFVYEDRVDMNDCSETGVDCSSADPFDDGRFIESVHSFRLYDTQRLDHIRICTTSGSDVTCDDDSDSITDYDLDYGFMTEYYPGTDFLGQDKEHETTRLTGIIKYGWNSSGTKVSLPTTSFNYGSTKDDSFPQMGSELDKTGSNQGDYLRYPRLLYLTNGYGGKVEFNYNDDDPYEYRWDADVLSYVVLSKEIHDGLSHTSEVTYTYTNPCFSGFGNDQQTSCLKGGEDERRLAVVGHEKTTTGTFDYDDTRLNTTVQHFITDTTVLQGREYQTKIYAPDDTLLQKSEVEWSTGDFVSTTVSYRDAVTISVYSAVGIAETTVVTYAYDTYSNVIGEYYSGDVTVIGDERSTHRDYWNLIDLDDELWLIGLPYSEKICSGLTECSTPETRTVWAYDDETHHLNNVFSSSHIDTGAVTMVGQGVWSGTPFVTTKSTYDTYGNLTETEDPLGHTTVITYDSTYHQFPIAVNTGGLVNTTNYYGVHEASISGDYGLFGQVQRTFDANGTATAVLQIYDAFGRLVRVVRPVDTVTYPTIEYAYDDAYNSGGLQGLEIRSLLRETSLQSGVIENVAYYDGMGRAVQTRNEKVGGASQYVVNTVYDALGQVTNQYAPVEEAWSANFNRPAGWDSEARTETLYNALGQAVREIQPDGTTSTTALALGWNQLSINRRGYPKLSVLDAFGNLVQVDESLAQFESDFTSSTSGWTLSGQTLDNGTLKHIGTGSWTSYERSSNTIGNQAYGQVVMVDFKVSGTTNQVVFALEKEYQRRFGVRVKDGIIEAQYNTSGTWVYPGTLINSAKANTWYVLLLKMTHDGKATVRVWEKENPANAGSVSFSMPSGTWTYHFKSWNYTTGAISWIDNYKEMDLATTTYTYDTLGNLTQVVNTLDLSPMTTVTTTMAYDELSRKESMADPDMGNWYYYYDAAGNLISQVDAEEQVIDFYYDDLNRLIGKIYGTTQTPSSYTGRIVNPTSSQLAVEYQYDATGKENYGKGYRTFMDDNPGETTWTYDERGLVTQEVKVIGSETFTTSTTYDALDRPVTVTYPDGEVVTTTYNDAGQPDDLDSDDNINYVSDASYTVLGQLSELVFGNDVSTRYGYLGLDGEWDRNYGDDFEDFGKLMRIRTANEYGEPLLDRRYGYDEVGNIDLIKDAPVSAADWPTISSDDVTFSDTFATLNENNWTGEYDSIENGTLKLAGTGAGWDAYIYRDSYALTSGIGLQVEFKVTNSYQATILGIEDADAADRRFSLRIRNGGMQVSLADTDANWKHPADFMAVTANIWYVLRVVVDDTGKGFYLEVYGKDTPANRASYNIWMPTGKSWRFKTWVYNNNCYLDNYFEFDATDLIWSGEEKINFSYDALDRLVDATPLAGGYSANYSYNAGGNMMTKVIPAEGIDWTYSYNNANHVHAVSAINGYGSYAYDANGNQTTRTIGSDTYNLAYNAENKLSVVTDTTTSVVSTFIYDGDGTLVMKEVDGLTTLYVGGLYEQVSQDTEGVIGEVGQITNLTHEAQTVELSHAFRNPVVFVQPPSYNESDQTVARILDVQSDQFTIKLQDAPDKTAAHTTETVSYIVLEEGTWELANNKLLEVGTVSTAATRSASPASWESVSFEAGFTSTPVIISQVQTNNDPQWVKTRQTSASSSGFSVAMEEDDVQTIPHGVERIGWLAIETNTSSGTWSGNKYEASLTANSVTQAWYTQNFQTGHFNSAPSFIAALNTYDGADGSYLRYQNLGSSSVQVMVEEDTTYDSETAHTTEAIGYLAIQGSGLLEGKMADTVEAKYYFFGGQRVAMRECVGASCDDPIYLHSDHLGSASLATDDDGELISDMRYYPYGATRSGTVGTDYRYTGQRADSYTQLYDYGARWYDPQLGRFITPDSIVPDPANPQSFNRFSYVENNPLKYIDPDGFEKIIIVYGIGYSKPTHSFYAAAHTQYREALAMGYTDDEILFTNVRSDEEFLWAIGKNDAGEIEGVYYFGHGDFADSSGSEGLLQITYGRKDESQFMSDEIDPTLENRFSDDAQIHLHACVVGATSLPQDMANAWGVSVYASPRPTKFYEPIDGFGPYEYRQYNGSRGTYDYETDVFQLPYVGPKLFNRPDEDAWNKFVPE